MNWYISPNVTCPVSDLLMRIAMRETNVNGGQVRCSSDRMSFTWCLVVSVRTVSESSVFKMGFDDGVSAFAESGTF